jgi:hypothetical protein
MRTKVKEFDQQAKMVVSCSDISMATVGLWAEYDRQRANGNIHMAESTYELMTKFRDALEQKGFWQ